MTGPEVSERVLSLLRETGALLEGHFLLSSGLHSEHYFQCARLLQHPEYAAEIGESLAEGCRRFKPELVVSPALGGIVIGHEVGRALGIRAIFTERMAGTLCLRRGFEISPGERVLVVEDVVTTGRSTMETVETVRSEGGDVVGLGAIVDRSGGADVPLPFHALVLMRTPTFEVGGCPVCLSGKTPLTKPGSREIPVP